MMTCPLPLDWLDLLEGRPSTAEHSHLDECPSCGAVVRALSDSDAFRDSLADGLRALVLRAVRVSLPSPPVFDHVEVGQLWWTVEVPEASVRLPILILGVDESDADTWLDVVPLWLDDWSGTNSDVLFAPQDSSSGVGWRAVFRYQFVVSAANLDVPIGVLTESGDAPLEEVLTGRVPAARTGNPIESEYDPRLAQDEWIAIAARALATDYASAADERAEPPVEEADVDVPSMQPEHPTIGVLLVLKVSRQPAPSEHSGEYQLAAATTSNALQQVRAAGEDPRTGARVDGWLRLTEADQLIFEVKEMVGVPERVRLSVYAATRGEPITTYAELKAGSFVVLGSDLAISEFDIQKLEIAAR